MAYTVVIEGVPIQCETAIEAAELARVAGGNTPPPPANHKNSTNGQSTVGSRWSKHRAKQFLGLIKGHQRRLIDALLDTPDGQNSRSAVQTAWFGRRTRSWRGYSRACTRMLRKLGLIRTTYTRRNESPSVTSSDGITA